jgi:hypothetical protein
MARWLRTLIAALALLAFCAPIAYADDDDDQGGPPKVSERSASSISDTAATLRARVDPNANDDWWWMGSTSYSFQFGPTTAYGVTAGNGSLQAWQDATTVSVPVSGLTPGTKYNYRAVATNVAGTTYGPNTTFKTSGKAPAATSNAPKPSVAPAPDLGHSIVAEATTGTVLVREQGATEFHPLGEVEEVPVNSTFDTTDGTVSIEASRGGDESNTGTFHGGTFQVRQSPDGKGITKIALRGGDFSACGTNGRATGSGHLVLRKLWGKDHGGRFKTTGRGSVATVRGTEWYTADRCDGTLTKVTKGAVMVRERGTGRSKLLHKGQSFLAHLPH